MCPSLNDLKTYGLSGSTPKEILPLLILETELEEHLRECGWCRSVVQSYRNGPSSLPYGRPDRKAVQSTKI